MVEDTKGVRESARARGMKERKVESEKGRKNRGYVRRMVGVRESKKEREKRMKGL